MKKHALLILAHEDPLHLGRLVRAVTAPWVTVFLHIDAKADLSEFRAVLAIPGVFAVEPRVKVRWRGWSQVQATLNAIRTAMDTAHFDYFTLLSGTHFPLRSPEYVRDYIESADSELINIVQVPNRELDKPLERFTKLSFDGMHRNRSIAGLCKRGIALALNALPRSLSPIFKEWTPYAGSQWWTLSAQAVKHVVKTAHDKPELLKAFRHLDVPDEGFFQTILGNSPFRDRCSRSVVYTDWSNPSEAPCFLRSRHIEDVYSPDFRLADAYGIGKPLYARKLGSRNLDVVEAILARHRRIAGISHITSQQ